MNNIYPKLCSEFNAFNGKIGISINLLNMKNSGFGDKDYANNMRLNVLQNIHTMIGVLIYDQFFEEINDHIPVV